MGTVCCQQPTNTGEMILYHHQISPIDAIKFDVYKGELELEYLVKERFQELKSRLKDKLNSSKYEGVVKRQPQQQSHQNFIYDGTWKDELPDGAGKILFKNGQYFEGEFEKGKAEGNGLYIFSNGDYYDGQISDNKAQGKGIYTGSLIYYDGLWENSKPTVGTFNLRAQETEIRMTEKDKGEIDWVNGDRYIGDIKNQKPDGFGVMRFENGNKYEGEWKNGYCEGQGKYNWVNGKSYEGQYVNGVKQGFGEFIYSSNRKYKGDWKNGKQHGFGKLIDNEEVSYQGYFRNGEPSADKPESNIYQSEQLPQSLNYEPRSQLNESRNTDRR